MYKLVTDSCCDLPYQLLEAGNVDFISMEVTLEGQTFEDDLGRTFPQERLYEKLKNGVLPATSQINIGRYAAFFRTYVSQNIPVLYLCFSSGMSGSYNSALQAVDLVKEEFPEADIYVLDTLAASAGLGLMVYDALEKQQAGYSMAQLIAWLEENKMSYNHWFTVNDLKHLYNGGRISRGSAAIGELLSIKPVLSLDPAGKLIAKEKVRTRKRSLQAVVSKIVADLENPAEQRIIISCSGDRESSEYVAQIIAEQVSVKEILQVNMGATIASHTGYGCLAVFAKGTVPRQ